MKLKELYNDYNLIKASVNICEHEIKQIETNNKEGLLTVISLCLCTFNKNLNNSRTYVSMCGLTREQEDVIKNMIKDYLYKNREDNKIKLKVLEDKLEGEYNE